jgi:hypothetical protein
MAIHMFKPIAQERVIAPCPRPSRGPIPVSCQTEAHDGELSLGTNATSHDRHTTRRPPRGADGVSPSRAWPGVARLPRGAVAAAAGARPIRAPFEPRGRGSLCSSRSCRGGTDNRAHPCPLNRPQSLCSSQIEPRSDDSLWARIARTIADNRCYAHTSRLLGGRRVSPSHAPGLAR